MAFSYHVPEALKDPAVFMPMSKASTVRPVDRCQRSSSAFPRNRPFVRVDSMLDQGRVAPENIIAVHYPWHAHARYAENDPEIVKATLAGEHDFLLNDRCLQFFQTPFIPACGGCYVRANDPTWST